jgi:predicted nucleic acid-binding protein
VIVADTNLIAYFLLPGEHTAEAVAVFRKDPEWAAPLLWRSELRSVLAHYLRRNVLSLQQALETMADAETMLQGREYTLPSEPIIRLAAESPCSAYDCEFIALAEELGVSLVTSDAQVLSAFTQTAISPARFVQ